MYMYICKGFTITVVTTTTPQLHQRTMTAVFSAMKSKNRKLSSDIYIYCMLYKMTQLITYFFKVVPKIGFGHYPQLDTSGQGLYCNGRFLLNSL